MAVHAPITGAPSRAPSNVIPFPDTPVARARRELRYCRDQLMLMKWCGRVKRQRGLSERDHMNLASLFAIRHDEIAKAGVR